MSKSSSWHCECLVHFWDVSTYKNLKLSEKVENTIVHNCSLLEGVHVRRPNILTMFGLVRRIGRCLLRVSSNANLAFLCKCFLTDCPLLKESCLFQQLSAY